MAKQPKPPRQYQREPPVFLQLDTHRTLLAVSVAGVCFAIIALVLAVGAAMNLHQRKEERALQPRTVAPAPTSKAPSTPATVEIEVE